MNAILFDIHGTLLDFKEYHSPYSDMLASMKLTPEENRKAVDLLLTCPVPTLETVDFLQEHFPGHYVPCCMIAKFEDELKVHFKSEFMMEGVEETLRELRRKGYKLGLISNLSTPYKEPIEAFGLLHLVDVVIYSCDVGYRKPQKEIFQKALEETGVEATQAVFVGDSPEDDMAGAVLVGIRGILIESDPVVPSTNSIRTIPELLRWFA